MSKSRYRQRLTDDEMEMLFREDATDEEIEAKVSSPRYWTYIVRHPNGFVVCHGRGRSRQTCERNAVRLAGQLVPHHSGMALDDVEKILKRLKRNHH